MAQKGLLLDQVVAMTGYARKYAIGLLNQAPQGKRTILRPRLPRYGSEVRHALVLAWEATKHLCAKRLIPFLPPCVRAPWAFAVEPGEPKAGVLGEHFHG